jgi:hypothetical protein
MGFLIKLGFWLSLTLLVIPFDGGSMDGQVETVSPMQALFAAREALGDVAGICDRKPEVCAAGKAAVTTIGVRAREGARVAYEFLDDQYGAPDETLHTGSLPNSE